jgi:predicted alpha/beta hydrolase family esterase
MKKQIVVIHGAEAFDSYDAYLHFLRTMEINFDEFRTPGKSWKKGLSEALGESFEVIAPSMPNKLNARYLEWEIWFDKLVPHFDPEVILIGHSMGGIFLAKYLALHTIPSKITMLVLVAAPFDSSEGEESLVDFVLPKDLSNISRQVGHVELFHSTDDPVVPFPDAKKYAQSIPNTRLTTFSDRGHFDQESLPELVAILKKL